MIPFNYRISGIRRKLIHSYGGDSTKKRFSIDCFVLILNIITLLKKSTSLEANNVNSITYTLERGRSFDTRHILS